MKTLAVSDKVLNRLYTPDVAQKHPDIQLLIGCGDLPFYYLDFLISSFNVPLFYVRGNHDNGKQYTSDGRVLTEVPGGIDLHCKTAVHKGLILAGLEGSMRYHPSRPYMYTDAEMSGQIMRLAPHLLKNKLKYGRYLDILITHSPPFGIHDLPDLPHTGFRSFLNFMRRFQPRYLLHGHIHAIHPSRPQITQFEQTTIINVYPFYKLTLDP